MASGRGWESLLERIAKNPDDVFPKVFPLVAELADQGDAVCREILFVAAASLGRLARCVADQLGGRDREFPIAKLGGAHGRSEYFDAAVNEELARVLPRSKVVALSMSPAEAAVGIAVRASRAAGNAASMR